MNNMHELIPHSLLETFLEKKIIALLIIEKKESIRPLVTTLYDAGIRIIEVALRTPIAIQSIQIIKKEFPNIIVGAGTVLTTEQLEEVWEHKVDFAVSPGLNERVLEKALALSCPFFPGVATPSDIEKAVSYGCRMLKFFPSEALGGLNYLKTIHAPYAHLQLSYIPLGGIHTSNLSQYIHDPIVNAIGGSWLAPVALINEGNWNQITQNVKDTLKVIEGVPR